MKRFLLTILFALVSLTVCFASQPMKHFKCAQFTFDYPATFKPIPISNAPHMRMKIASSKYIFTASCWNKNLDSNVSIWDDTVFENIAGLPINGELLGVEKITIETKYGRKRAVRQKSIVKDGSHSYCSITYFMINDGYLFIFCFFTDSSNAFFASSLQYQERFFKGLSFKKSTTSVSSDDEFYSYLLKTVKELNAQCPIRSDEVTTFRSVVLSGKTVCIKTTIAGRIKDYLDFDILKEKFCQNFCKALQKEFVEYLNRNNYSLSYFIFDEEENLVKVLTISPQDVLAYSD